MIDNLVVFTLDKHNCHILIAFPLIIKYQLKISGVKNDKQEWFRRISRLC